MKDRFAKVYELYERHHTLDPFDIAEREGIEYRYVPYLKSPEGQFVKIEGEPLILLNDRLKDSRRKYFIMAHEIYHAIWHSELAGYYIDNAYGRGKLEMEANKFAACFLYSLYHFEEGRAPESYFDLHYKYGLDLNVAEDFYTIREV